MAGVLANSRTKISLGSLAKDFNQEHLRTEIKTDKDRANSLLKHELKSSIHCYNLSIASHFHKIFLYLDSNYLKGYYSLLQSSRYIIEIITEKSHDQTTDFDIDLFPRKKAYGLPSELETGGIRPTASASPRNLFEMYNLGPYPRCSKSETLGVSPTNPAICVLASPPGDSGTYSSLRLIALNYHFLLDQWQIPWLRRW